MDTIRRIDTTIAFDILDRYDRNDNVYIPYEIAPYSPGRIILASCDNIDVLEQTIDEKNTFHWTQMMLWQRGPKNERSDEKYPKICRGRTLNPDKLAPFTNWTMHLFQRKDQIQSSTMMYKSPQKTGLTMGNKKNQNSKTPHCCWHQIMTKNK